MIVTERKPFQKIIDSLKGYNRIFLVGCGECATTCKTGGEQELLEVKRLLEEQGSKITGMCIPQAPCLASQIKTEFAKNLKNLKESEAILVLACGLGVQSAKGCERFGLAVLPGCDTLFGAVMDSQGNFLEKCSLCGECVLHITGGICPVTLCAKGLLNGPCGGMNKGKCEVDKEKDCAWVLIYNELEKRKKLGDMKAVQPPKDYKKVTRPRKLILSK